MGRGEAKRICGWAGVICWLLILPAKGARYFDPALDPGLVNIAPSLFGPAGLLFVILSNEGRFKDLGRIYTFDWLDVLATMAALGVAALVSALIGRTAPRG